MVRQYRMAIAASPLPDDRRAPRRRAEGGRPCVRTLTSQGRARRKPKSPEARSQTGGTGRAMAGARRAARSIAPNELQEPDPRRSPLR